MALPNESEPVEKRQMLETVSEESENISKQDYYMERMKNIVEKCLDKKERDNAMVSGLKDHFSQMVEEYSEAFGQLLTESQQQTFQEMESVESDIETSFERITTHEQDITEFKEATISLLSSGCNKRSAEDDNDIDSSGTMKKRALDSESNIKQFYLEKMKAIVDKCAEKREKDNAIVAEIKSHLSKMVDGYCDEFNAQIDESKASTFKEMASIESDITDTLERIAAHERDIVDFQNATSSFSLDNFR